MPVNYVVACPLEHTISNQDVPHQNKRWAASNDQYQWISRDLITYLQLHQGFRNEDWKNSLAAKRRHSIKLEPRHCSTFSLVSHT